MSEAAAILKAVNYAAVKHRGQVGEYDTTAPFINHPIGVANILAQAGETDVELLQAALVHDVVEHTDTTQQQITEGKGRIKSTLSLKTRSGRSTIVLKLKTTLT